MIHYRAARKLTLLLVIFTWAASARGTGATQLLTIPTADVAARILPMWAGYRSEIATADIRYRYSFISCTAANLTADGFLEQLQDVDLRQSDQLLTDLIARFSPELIEAHRRPENPFPLWEEKTLLLRGAEQRSTGLWHDHLIQGELHLLADLENRHVKAYARGNCPYGHEPLTWFREIPDDSVLRPPAIVIDHGELLDIHYTASVDQPGSRLTISADDGLPRRWDFVPSEAEEVTLIRIHADQTLFPGDVWMPGVKLEAGFAAGKLSSLRMSVITSAEFNQEIPDERFVMRAAAGTGWLDGRSSEKNGGTWEKALPDVAAFFSVHQGLPAAAFGGGTTSGFRWRSLFLVLNGLLLMVAGLILWKKAP